MPRSDVAPPPIAQHERHAPGGQAQREQHPRLLADAGGPVQQRGQEEQQHGVAPVVALREPDPERPVEPVEAPEAEPRVDQEPAELGRSREDVDGAGDEPHHLGAGELRDLDGVDPIPGAGPERGGQPATGPVVAARVGPPRVDLERHRVADQRAQHLGDERGDEQPADPRVGLPVAGPGQQERPPPPGSARRRWRPRRRTTPGSWPAPGRPGRPRRGGTRPWRRPGGRPRGAASAGRRSCRSLVRLRGGPGAARDAVVDGGEPLDRRVQAEVRRPGCAADPSVARRSASAASAARAAARASGSSGGTRTPSTPSVTTSGMPRRRGWPRRGGRPPSPPAARWAGPRSGSSGRTRRRRPGGRARRRGSRRTRPARPGAWATWARRSSSSGPAPTRTSRAPGPRPTARTRVAWSFLAVKLPTVPRSPAPPRRSRAPPGGGGRDGGGRRVDPVDHHLRQGPRGPHRGGDGGRHG